MERLFLLQIGYQNKAILILTGVLVANLGGKCELAHHIHHLGTLFVEFLLGLGDFGR
jgi:hypothetical protein